MTGVGCLHTSTHTRGVYVCDCSLCWGFVWVGGRVPSMRVCLVWDGTRVPVGSVVPVEGRAGGGVGMLVDLQVCAGREKGG